MACDEIDLMRRQVCASMRSTVNTWHEDLQSQWGDPRVYAAQQQQLAAREASLAHDLSRRNTKLLDDAYESLRTKQKREHESRLHRGRKSGTRPVSAGGQPRTALPRPQPPAEPAATE